ncbi:hypothetical protein FRX31_010729 [Thalictrum thalictroides]|uniref:RNase H type-1 domain-containing protein n=1 Tax=Thalictrum thalictroides TaxID=46969 RepID=A0A7J6WRS9_THATH|nr:hypothetical protein FRX31_010729 [Thalictrum thalictroides]
MTGATNVGNYPGHSNGTIWIPPIDISFDNADSSIGIGYLLRSSNGNVIFAGNESGNAGSAEEGECRGIQAAICAVIRSGFDHQLSKLIVETDSVFQINVLHGRSRMNHYKGYFMLGMVDQG